jgi:hypothetical protein
VTAPRGLLAVAAAAVALTVHDAAAALAAHGAPTFLFLLLPAAALQGGGRLASLAAQVALPALAVLLPALSLAVALIERRRSPRSPARSARCVWALAAGLLLLGLAADAALYRTLGAVPGAARRESAPRRASESSPTRSASLLAVRPATVEKIVFSSDRDGTWQLVAMNPDGSGQERLTASGRAHMQPRFSPDGTQVVFSSTADRGGVVMLFDWATRVEREVCAGDQASFTGDGRGIVFRRDGRIWRRDLASGAEVRLSPAMWTRCSFPSAAPGPAGRVAFASRLLAGYNIYVVAEGAEPTRLVARQGACDPRWSPGGRRLSYQTETHIFVMDLDGANVEQVTFGAGVQHYAAWSPDEKHLAYCQGPDPEGPWQILRVALDSDAEPVYLADGMYPDWGRVPATSRQP